MLIGTSGKSKKKSVRVRDRERKRERQIAREKKRERKKRERARKRKKRCQSLIRVPERGTGGIFDSNYNQCCHIGRYIADWATFESHLLQKNCLRYFLYLLYFGLHLSANFKVEKNSILETNSDFV